MIKIDMNMNWKSKKTVIVCDIFFNSPAFDLKLVAGAVGAGAASRYGSSSDSGYTKIMPLLAALAPQH
jgi:hypothetical protein